MGTLSALQHIVAGLASRCTDVVVKVRVFSCLFLFCPCCWIERLQSRFLFLHYNVPHLTTVYSIPLSYCYPLFHKVYSMPYSSTPCKYTLLFILLHCSALYCITPYRTILHCTALHCTALHCTALHTALPCTALHYTTPHHTT